MLGRKPRAQSVVEYVLVLGGIILAVVYGANLLSGKAKEQAGKTGKILDKAGEEIDKIFP